MRQETQPGEAAPTGRRLLELIDVHKRYDSPGSDEPTEVLRGVTLSLAQGQRLAVVGPSGSGKSTLLNIIAALDRPTGGKVFLDGRDLWGRDEKDLAMIRNRRIGLVFQFHHLLPQCTVMENVLLPTLALPGRSRNSRNRDRDRAGELLERVGLSARLNYRPGLLSGGESQRVAVVRALINGPDLLLADEPTGSLDAEASEDMARLLVEMNLAEGVAMIVVTHSIDVARKMSDVLELRDGVLSPAPSHAMG